MVQKTIHPRHLCGRQRQGAFLNSEESFGFTIGIVSNLRLGEYFDLRFVPDLAFGERDLIYEIEYDDQNLPGFSPDTLISDKKIYSTLVEFPVILNIKPCGSRIPASTYWPE